VGDIRFAVSQHHEKHVKAVPVMMERSEQETSTGVPQLKMVFPWTEPDKGKNYSREVKIQGTTRHNFAFHVEIE